MQSSDSSVSRIAIWFNTDTWLELAFWGNHFALDKRDRELITEIEARFRGHVSVVGEGEPASDTAKPIEAKNDPWVCRKCGAEVAPTVTGDGMEAIVHGCVPSAIAPKSVTLKCRVCDRYGAVVSASEGLGVDWTCEECIEAEAEPVDLAKLSQLSTELPLGMEYLHCCMCGVQSASPIDERPDGATQWTCSNCQPDTTEPELKPPAGGL